MPCESIRPVIRTFLDDLLDENDYQNIQSHVAVCERCHTYASSVGTLSYRLYELGQVSVPPDMSATILYEFEKQSHAAAAPQAVSPADENGAQGLPGPGLRFVWVIVLLISAAAFVAVITMVSIRRVHRVQKEDSAAVIPSASVSSVGLSKETAPASGPVPGAEKSKEISTHWHYHVSKSSLSELKQLFSDLYLTVLDESPGYLVFYVPKERLGKFTSRMAGLSGVVKEYGEIDPSKVSAEAVQVSLYLE